jgi:hypothetical protein
MSRLVIALLGALMRRFVLWLFADFLFRPDNLTQAINVIRLETFLCQIKF